MRRAVTPSAVIPSVCSRAAEAAVGEREGEQRGAEQPEQKQ
jgi:hypothetical protein